MKKYTVYFYATDRITGDFSQQYDVFSGTRYECYKWKKGRLHFGWQYKVCKT